MRYFAFTSQSIFVAGVSALSLLGACSSTPEPAQAHAGSGPIAAGAPGLSSGGTGPAGGSSSGLSAGTSSGGATGVVSGGSGGSAALAAGGLSSSTAGAGVGGSPAGVAGAAGGGAVSACPANATFCSGFEVTTLPTGAVYKANAAPGEWTRDFEVDSTLFHSGKSSLRVKSGTESGGSGAYRMLAVPAPTGAFWVRFYIQQTELDLGGPEHNVFASASASDEPNAASIEFAEDVGIAFNTSDAVRWPMGYGRLTSGGTAPFSLGKGMWHCIEISFDGQGREQQLFINNMPQIDAKDYPSTSPALKNFKFGFNQLHGPARKVWYDDIAVAPSRIKCL